MRRRASYRLQLEPRLTFADAASLAGYLADLGVSHLYSSPVLQAVRGSAHGYDVVDPAQVSEELGGEEGLAGLHAALEGRELGLLLDIVPNHMATDPSNAWWWDVLENGPGSPYAGYFDIDWGRPAGSVPLLVPVLDDQYGRVLEAGRLQLVCRGAGVAVRYEDRELPISPATLPQGLTDPAGEPGRVEEWVAGVNRDLDGLDTLLDAQHYRLAHWRSGDEELNYRRFFDIDSLVGVRVEVPEVFAATHARVLDLVDAGVVDGLRVDHVDGLRDPAGYLKRLAGHCPAMYIVAEKILGTGEALAADWPVAGTTGYDFLFRVNNLFVASENEPAMTDCYTAFTGEPADFGEVAREAKRQVLRHDLAAEVDRVVALAAAVTAQHRPHIDDTPRALHEAVLELVVHFDVYRTYVEPGAGASEEDRAALAGAVARTAADRPDLDRGLLELLGRFASGGGDGPLARELACRLQQLTAPAMAKGVEDTAFYRYLRLVSLNEVGGDPGVFGRSVADFHEDTASSAARWPASMLTLATHDTKRGPDLRARVNVLSQLPEEWRRAVEQWSTVNDVHRRGGWPDRSAEYLLYQTLVGCWPVEADRICAYMAKAVREAKVHTSWGTPQPEYESSVESFTRSVIGDRRFVQDLEAFLSSQRVVERGRRSSLAQTALLLTSPGVPDIYQGSELWDHSLVDPDNRRPVDFELRRSALARLRASPSVALAAHEQAGAAKLFLVHRLLVHRRERPCSFEGGRYEPLAVHGERADEALAFLRPDLAVIVPRLGGDRWERTYVELPPGAWTDVVTGRPADGGRGSLTDLLAELPVAVLSR